MKRRRTSRVLAILALVFGATSLAGGGAAGFLKSQTTLRLWRDGAVAEAVILAKDSRTHRPLIGRSKTVHRVEFAFEPPNHGRVLSAEEVTKARFDALEVGGRAEAAYWRADPGVNSIDGVKIAGDAVIAFLVGAGVGGPFVWLGLFTLRDLRLRRRVVETGRRVDAVVTGHRTIPTRGGRRRGSGGADEPGALCALRWRFTDAQGVERSGESDVDGANRLRRWPVGAVIPVLHDPADPDVSFWERDLQEGS